MKAIDRLIDKVIAREGGFSDHPADRGGATRWGITERVARREGYGGPMRALPRATAVEIYRRLYWTVPRIDRVAVHAPELAAEIFDTGVNMGPKVAVELLQRALNVLNRGASDYPDVATDGVVGPATLDALGGLIRTRGRAAEAVLVKAVDGLQCERYIALAERRPANEAFVYGWILNRIG